MDSRIRNVRRQHFRGQRLTLARGGIIWLPIECAVRWPSVTRCYGHIVSERNRTRNRRGKFCFRCAEFHGEAANLIRSEREHQVSAAYTCGGACYRHLLSIHLVDAYNWRGESQMNVGLFLAADFDEAHDYVVAFFGFLHRENANAVVICF